MNTWQLPEGIDELSGEQALNFEILRRQLIDLYTKKGFGLVIPPMVEHVDSLLLTSDSVNEKTFKFLDPVSGKMLGVHADITPQIARIDARRASTLTPSCKPVRMIFMIHDHLFRRAQNYTDLIKPQLTLK